MVSGGRCEDHHGDELSLVRIMVLPMALPRTMAYLQPQPVKSL